MTVAPLAETLTCAVFCSKLDCMIASCSGWGWGGVGWGGVGGLSWRGLSWRGGVVLGVKYRMLHIPGILDCTYHLHVSVSVCSRF